MPLSLLKKAATAKIQPNGWIFCFHRQLHLRAAVIYVRVNALACNMEARPYHIDNWNLRNSVQFKNAAFKNDIIAVSIFVEGYIFCPNQLKPQGL